MCIYAWDENLEILKANFTVVYLESEKAVCRGCIFDNMVLYVECRMNKNLLRTF